MYKKLISYVKYPLSVLILLVTLWDSSFVSGSSYSKENFISKNEKLESKNQFTHLARAQTLAPWQFTSPMNVSRQSPASVTYNGYIYVLGDTTTDNCRTVEYSKINLSSGSLDPWEYTSNLIGGRGRGAAVVANGYIYALGGGCGGASDTVERAKINPDGSLDTWILSSPMLRARYFFTAVVSGDYIYAIGGQDFDRTVDMARINSDGSLGSWQRISELMNYGRQGFVSVVFGGYIYVIGGMRGTDVVEIIERAFINPDGSLEAWENIDIMSPPRYMFGGGIGTGYIYAIAGDTSTWDAGINNSVSQMPMNGNGTLAPNLPVTPIQVNRKGLAAAFYGNCLYAIGGYHFLNSNFVVLNSVEYSCSPPMNVTEVNPIFMSPNIESELIIHGDYFHPIPLVSIHDQELSLQVRYVSPTELIVTIPSQLNLGWHSLMVINPFDQTYLKENAFAIDGQSPEGFVSINNGAINTDWTSVNLFISSTDDLSGVDKMSFSNDGIEWTEWESFSPTKSWSLTPGFGIRTVFVRFVDHVGNVSEFVTDTIFLLRKVFLPVTLKNFSSLPITILLEDFEGEFPGEWLIEDNYHNIGYVWGKNNCRPYAGNYSGWSIGGGVNGSVLPCGSYYPYNVDSWMIYGPFNLADAVDADLSFQLLLASEIDYDEFCYFASTNGDNFGGNCISGTFSGWQKRTVSFKNFPYFGNLIGNSQVWIAFYFYSDNAYNLGEGAYLDNVLLRKCKSGCVLPQTSNLNNDINPSFDENTTYKKFEK